MDPYNDMDHIVDHNMVHINVDLKLGHQWSKSLITCLFHYFNLKIFFAIVASFSVRSSHWSPLVSNRFPRKHSNSSTFSHSAHKCANAALLFAK